VGTRLPKFTRIPEHFSSTKTTDRDLGLIRTISEYRLASSSQLVELVGGNEDVTYRHLQRLFHLGLINRFSLPRHGYPGEFVYYLDEPAALKLTSSAPDGEIEESALKAVRLNKKKRYSQSSSKPSQLLFLQHELMISRFHFMVAIACRQAQEEIQLSSWKQGAELWSKVSIEAPDGKVASAPHRPDAFLTLSFPQRNPGLQRSHFFYEADRGTMSTQRLKAKFQCYIEFLHQLKHTEQYGIRKIRAILIETVSAQSAQRLRETARELCPDIPLFWFSSADILMDEHSRPGAAPKVNVVADKVWWTTTDDDLRIMSA
jgi:Replication-relaxation